MTAAPAEAEERLAREFADAFAADDVDQMVAMLSVTAWLAMPPATERYEGSEAIAGFLLASAAGQPGGRYRPLPTRAGGHHGFGCYLQGRARGLLVVTADHQGTTIATITRFLDDGLHRHFGLPDQHA